MYATNGQTDGQTKATFIASFPTGGGITILLRYAIAARVANKQTGLAHGDRITCTSSCRSTCSKITFSVTDSVVLCSSKLIIPFIAQFTYKNTQVPPCRHPVISIIRLSDYIYVNYVRPNSLRIHGDRMIMTSRDVTFIVVSAIRPNHTHLQHYVPKT